MKTCERWSEENLLFFNPDKTVLMHLGPPRIKDIELKLYGKILQEVRVAKLLGLTLDGNISDPFVSARNKTKTWCQLVYLKIQKIIGNVPYKFIKILYHAFFISGGFYASEIFNDFHPNFQSYEQKLPKWLKVANQQYRKLFNFKKPSKEEILKNKYKMSPLLPSQIVIQKDLNLIFDVNAGNSTVEENQIVGNFKAYHKNRAASHSNIRNALTFPNRHVERLSLIKRYNDLLLKREKDPMHPFYEIEKLKPKERYGRILDFLNSLNCRENDLRRLIFEGKHCETDTVYYRGRSVKNNEK